MAYKLNDEGCYIKEEFQEDPAVHHLTSIKNELEDLKEHRESEITSLLADKYLFINNCLQRGEAPTRCKSDDASLLFHNEVKCARCPFSTKVKADFIRHVSNCTATPTVSKTVATVEDASLLFKCSRCTYLARDKFDLDSHILNSHTFAEMKCSLCKFRTSSRILYDAHTTAHNNVRLALNKFYCHMCNYGTFKKEALISHMSNHGFKPFQCTFCPYSGKRRCDLRSHVQGVHGSTKWSCAHCKYSSKWKRCLEHHMQVHRGLRTLTCDRCGYLTKRKQTLIAHMELHRSKCGTNSEDSFSVHAGDSKTKVKQFRCAHCDYVSKRKDNLTAHVQGRHGQLQLECQHCSYKTKWKRSLDIHNEVCHSLKEFKCYLCDYSTKRKRSLVSHVRMHSFKLHHCKQCKYRSYKKSSLSKHVAARHHLEELKCEYCDYVTSDEQEFVTHLKAAHGSEEFIKCEQCSYTTRWKYKLVEHVEGYHTSKLFTCEQCDYTTTWKKYLKQHQALHTHSVVTIT